MVLNNSLLMSVKTLTSESDGFIWKLIDRHVEGVRGPLTEFDSEESPLSKVQAATTRKQTEMVGFRLQKRTMQGVYDDVERQRLPCGR